jgi:hypothetical protein
VFKSTPGRDAMATWTAIVDLLTQGKDGPNRTEAVTLGELVVFPVPADGLGAVVDELIPAVPVCGLAVVPGCWGFRVSMIGPWMEREAADQLVLVILVPNRDRCRAPCERAR